MEHRAGPTGRRGAASRAEERRAPRLRPDERIAPFITRRGRFAARDPAEVRPLPGVWKLAGVVAWAAWMAYPAIRGWRERAGPADGADATDTARQP